MSKTDTGGYAFPIGECPGMSLRDWFAGRAMQTFLANVPTEATYDDVADKAYRMADAMLTARKEKKR